MIINVFSNIKGKDNRHMYAIGMESGDSICAWFHGDGVTAISNSGMVYDFGDIHPLPPVVAIGLLLEFISMKEVDPREHNIVSRSLLSGLFNPCRMN